MYQLIAIISLFLTIGTSSPFEGLNYSVHKGGYIRGTESTVISTDYWIEVHNMNVDSLNAVTTKEQWIAYLDDESTSWEANIVLHAIYRENAYWFFAFDDKQKWFADRRIADVRMWKKRLKEG